MKTPKPAAPVARPLALIPMCLVLAVAAYALMVGCGGKSQETAQNPTPAPDTTSQMTQQPAAPDTSPEAMMALGEQVYKDRCVLCHGPEGKGDGVGAAGLNPKPRNHTDGKYMRSRTDEQLIEVIKNGKGGMPAWGAILSDHEVHAVLKKVRSLAK